MRTNPIICLNLEDYGRSRRSVRFIACARTDNIKNSSGFRCKHINIEKLKTRENIRTAHTSHAPHSAFVLDELEKNRYYRLIKRMWRNWQTRRLQEPVGIALVEVRLLSSALARRHSRGLFLSTHNLIKGPLQADKYLG